MSKLIFPPAILQQHLVVLGKTGAGKSSALRHIVEHLLREGKRVCVVDPKGDWWGLKSAGAGKGAGFPVIAFGDFKNPDAADVPINAQSGKHVAELITTGNRPCLIGFRGWTASAMIRFWIDFASTLFNANSGELYLVGDEFHNFAPKGKIMDPEAGKCLHWSNRLMSEGRGYGLVCLIASQRPQKVHNDTLTCCETLVAMRLIHKADRDAVEDWIDGCGDKARGTEVLNALAGMARGEAFVWSPENEFGPVRLKFPMFETFDSFAPPQLQKAISKTGWAAVNLDEVKQKLSAVIEEVKANDPRELKMEIARLKKAQASPAAGARPEIKEVSILTKDDVIRLETLLGELQMVRKGLDPLAARIEGLHGEVGYFKGILSRLSTPQKLVPLVNTKRSISNNGGAAAVRRPVSDLSHSNGTLDGSQQTILDTIAMLNRRGLAPDREMLARWMDLHPNGGRYGQNLGYLRREGFLTEFTLTTKGEQSAATLPTGIDSARAGVDVAKQEIFDVLANSGAEYDREGLAAELGLHPNGGRYGQNLGRLRTMGLIPERGTIKLTPAAYA